jgi:hypothetical protein
MHETAFHHDYYGNTTVHPVALLILAAMGVLTLVLPRRYAIWPMSIVACFITPAQRIVIVGADFAFLRIMILFGCARLVLRGEMRHPGWGKLDTALSLWVTAELVFGVMQSGLGILMNRLGFAFDAIGMYLLFRILIRQWDDVKMAVLGFSVIVIPVALFFALELRTGRNMFAAFGGVTPTTIIRDGRLRCQAAFAHPILAGLFWAALLPLMVAQFWESAGRRYIAGVGVAGALFVIFACASASAITALAFAAIGGAVYPLRYRLRLIRWGFVCLLVVLHMIMKAPVWHLITRFDIVGGSSGYHRYQLIDGAIRHVNEWWLMGSTKGTGHWGWFTFDVTNYYIVQGLHGGILLLGLYVVLIGRAFGAVGRLWRRSENDKRMMAWSWCLGISLFVHATNFIVITYFGQIDMIWYLLLAMIGSAVMFKPGKNGSAEVQRSRTGRGRGRTVGSTAAGVSQPHRAHAVNDMFHVRHAEPVAGAATA